MGSGNRVIIRKINTRQMLDQFEAYGQQQKEELIRALNREWNGHSGTNCGRNKCRVISIPFGAAQYRELPFDGHGEYCLSIAEMQNREHLLYRIDIEETDILFALNDIVSSGREENETFGVSGHMQFAVNENNLAPLVAYLRERQWPDTVEIADLFKCVQPGLQELLQKKLRQHEIRPDYEAGKRFVTGEVLAAELDRECTGYRELYSLMYKYSLRLSKIRIRNVAPDYREHSAAATPEEG